MNKSTYRIVHLTSAHPRDDVRIFLKQCLSLARREYEVILMVADGLGDDTINGVKIIDVGASKGRIHRVLKLAPRLMRGALKQNADLYHLHDPELLPVGLQLKRNGKRVVFDSHEDTPKQILSKPYINPFLRRAVAWAFSKFERYACSQFDGIIAATPSIRNKFLNINSKSIDINNFPIVGELKNFVPWTQKSNEICYVGNISEARGIHELILAMSLTSHNTRLNLVGDFSEDDCKAKAFAQDGWARTNYIGRQDRLGIREVMRRSLAGLVTLHPKSNYLDALPVKMFEYMSAGIPVIASNFELWRSIIEETKCGLCVDPLNPTAIAHAIDYLVAHPHEAHQMGQCGRDAVETHFNWSMEESKMCNFYNEILNSFPQ